jgi:hypothetical protein
LILSALAPFVLAFAMENIGIPSSLGITAALGGLSIVALLSIAALQHEQHRPAEQR